MRTKWRLFAQAANRVSILVVLEFGLWEDLLDYDITAIEFQSLLFWNSVCEPIVSGSGYLVVYSFNPCCFGIRSVSAYICFFVDGHSGFQSLLFWNSVCEDIKTRQDISSTYVSILVVLEFGLWAEYMQEGENISLRFNPCCFGIRSVRQFPISRILFE